MKQFKDIGIQHRSSIVNYVLTLHVGTTKLDLYGNSYSVLAGYLNDELVITIKATLITAESLISEALTRLKLPRSETALLELGVYLAVSKYTIKQRDAFRDYSDWCAV